MKRSAIWRLIGLAWAFLVVIFYYIAHKPFTAANLIAWGQTLAGLGGAGIVGMLGTGLGLPLLRRVDLTPTERLIWAAGLGPGVGSLVGLGLGGIGLLRPWTLWLLTMAGLAATARPLWQALKAAWADPTWRPRTRFEKVLAAY